MTITSLCEPDVIRRATDPTEIVGLAVTWSQWPVLSADFPTRTTWPTNYRMTMTTGVADRTIRWDLTTRTGDIPNHGNDQWITDPVKPAVDRQASRSDILNLVTGSPTGYTTNVGLWWLQGVRTNGKQQFFFTTSFSVDQLLLTGVLLSGNTNFESANYLSG